MERKSLSFISLPNIPLPISLLPSFCLSSSRWLRQPRDASAGLMWRLTILQSGKRSIFAAHRPN
jgi:hypothetical protein